MQKTNLDDSKKKIIEEFFSRKDNEGFKGFKIQAGPGTGKTFLLKEIILNLLFEFNEDKISIVSFSNSSIDTISNKIDNQSNIEIKTIASFFIENFIIPFSFSILNSAEINSISIKSNGQIILINEIKKFLKEITINFSENSISSSLGWDILDGIIEQILIEDKYFDLFYNFLIQKGIKYILVDEYQDTKKSGIEVFNKVIKKGGIKFICVGDKNQQINYEEVSDNYYLGLENRVLDTTYRFNNDILEYLNKILDSGIKKSSCGFASSETYFFHNYKPLQKADESKRLTNLCEFIISYINNNLVLFKSKNNVILFQPSTDYNFGENFNKKLKNILSNNEKIKFSYTEKPIYNIHLKLFFENLIGFVNGDNSYAEVEKELNFFYLNQESNFQDIFLDIIKLSPQDELSKISSLLKDGFKSGGKYKNYFNEICDHFNGKKNTFKNAQGKKLIEILNVTNDENIYISTATITSSKGKEYDNVIILNIYGKPKGIDSSFSKEIKENNEEAKRHYYVAVSRAKENVFTFVKF